MKKGRKAEYPEKTPGDELDLYALQQITAKSNNRST